MANGYVFSGDFIYPGPLYAFLPNSSMGDYLQGSDAMLSAASEHVHILGAHRDAAPAYPREYRVNERIQLLAEPRLLRDW